MRAQRERKINTKRTSLHAIKGFKGQEEILQTAINAAWNVARTSLWNTCIFSAKETEDAKEWIRFYFLQCKDINKAYAAFCQRVLLTRQYLGGGSNRYVSLPSVWFNPENKHGFAGTRNWYLQLKAIRESLPLYKKELKAFGEAIWELQQDPTPANFHHWRSYFIDAKANSLLNLFLSTVANQQFQNRDVYAVG